MRRRNLAKIRWMAASCAMAWFLHAQPVLAHRTVLQTAMAPIPSSPSLLRIGPRTLFKLTALRGGQVQLRMSGVRDGLGNLANATGNELRLDLVVDGTPQVSSFPFSIESGRARLKIATLGVPKLGVIEVKSVELRDSGDQAFATLGVTIRD